MRLFKASLAVLLLAGVAAAQSTIPLPAFSSTYSYISNTRGFHFKAPRDFTITAVQVPDETKHGKQNVAIINMGQVTTPNGTVTAKELKFLSTGLASNTVVPCKVDFRKDDWVCILGACGDSTMMHNSYGTGGFNSNLLALPITLNRLTYQFNLVTGKGLGAIADGGSGSIGRVLVTVVPANLPPLPPKAVAATYGAGGYQFPPPSVAGKINPGPFARTYTSSQTRGFSFQAPVGFNVTAVQVPDEATKGLQAVAVYKLKAVTAWPTLSPVTPAFYKEGVASTSKIMVVPPVFIAPGEYLVVLGACYATGVPATLSNSYGNAAVPATLGGKAITLTRVVYQAAITAAKGVGSIATEAAGSIGRVNVEYSTGSVPTLGINALPVTNTTASVDFDANLSTATAAVVGLSFGKQSLTIPLGTILINPPFLILPITGTKGTVNLPIPNDQLLWGGGPFTLQGFCVCTPYNFGMSNGVEWTIGGR